MTQGARRAVITLFIVTLTLAALNIGFTVLHVSRDNQALCSALKDLRKVILRQDTVAEILLRGRPGPAERVLLREHVTVASVQAVIRAYSCR